MIAIHASSSVSDGSNGQYVTLTKISSEWFTVTGTDASDLRLLKILQQT